MKVRTESEIKADSKRTGRPVKNKDLHRIMRERNCSRPTAYKILRERERALRKLSKTRKG